MSPFVSGRVGSWLGLMAPLLELAGLDLGVVDLDLLDLGVLDRGWLAMGLLGLQPNAGEQLGHAGPIHR
mgnify:CR=1 FL=1